MSLDREELSKNLIVQILAVFVGVIGGILVLSEFFKGLPISSQDIESLIITIKILVIVNILLVIGLLMIILKLKERRE